MSDGLAAISGRPRERSNFRPAYQPDIDGLRAVAILSVVAFHAFPTTVAGGYAGVDVFFVISGFLISTILFRSHDEGGFRLGEFYVRRVLRIVPPLLAVLASSLAAGWWLLVTDEYAQLGTHAAAAAGFVLNFVLWGEAGYFDVASESKPLMHLWSLSIEEQFYLLFPVMLWAVWRWGRWLAIALAAMIAGSFAANLRLTGSDAAAAFFLPHARFWELLAGSVLAYATLRSGAGSSGDTNHLSAKVGATTRNAMAMAGAGLIAVAVGGLPDRASFPGWWALLPVSGAALILLAGPSSWLNRHVLASGPFVFVGLISYPLYLWHWPVFSFSRLYFPEPTILHRLALVAASVVLATLSYRLIETPIRSGPRGGRKATALFVAMAAIGLVGYGIRESDGVAARFSAEIRPVADFRYDYAKDTRLSTCWLYPGQPTSDFAPTCRGGGHGSTLRDGMVLWGDSHAGALYPGLRRAFGEGAAIAQFSRSSCPPSLKGVGGPCLEGNLLALSIIEKERPATVIMFARWNGYDMGWGMADSIAAGVLEGARRARAAGAARVLVIGPSPQGLEPLGRRIYRAWVRSGEGAEVPERLQGGLDPSALATEEKLKAMLAQEEIEFVSLRNILCDPRGCLARVTDDPSSLVFWDYGHLTSQGAEYVARRLPIAVVGLPQ